MPGPVLGINRYVTHTFTGVNSCSHTFAHIGLPHGTHASSQAHTQNSHAHVLSWVHVCTHTALTHTHRIPTLYVPTDSHTHMHEYWLDTPCVMGSGNRTVIVPLEALGQTQGQGRSAARAGRGAPVGLKVLSQRGPCLASPVCVSRSTHQEAVTGGLG